MFSEAMTFDSTVVPAGPRGTRSLGGRRYLCYSNLESRFSAPVRVSAHAVLKGREGRVPRFRFLRTTRLLPTVGTRGHPARIVAASWMSGPRQPGVGPGDQPLSVGSGGRLSRAHMAALVRSATPIRRNRCPT